MFFSIDEKVDEVVPLNGTQPSGAVADAPTDFGFYFYFTVNNIIQIVTIVLNLFVTGLIITHRKKSLGVRILFQLSNGPLQTPFYALAALLMTILCITGAVNEVNHVLFAGFGVRFGVFQWTTTVSQGLPQYYPSLPDNKHLHFLLFRHSHLAARTQSDGHLRPPAIE